jgi:helix-turn-helix resolvase-like protein
MSGKRDLTMRQLRQMLRLYHDGVSAREIARTLGVARSTIQDNLLRARAAGIGWPLPAEWSVSGTGSVPINTGGRLDFLGAFSKNVAFTGTTGELDLGGGDGHAEVGREIPPRIYGFPRFRRSLSRSWLNRNGVQPAASCTWAVSSALGPTGNRPSSAAESGH